MADGTGIGWTNATWNPVRGCERVSEGCRRCYAEVLAARHSYEGGWGHEVAHYVGGQPRWTGVIEVPNHARKIPLKWRTPRRVFVNSMSDLFHDRVPYNALDAIYAVMGMCPQHTFQILTKRPARMLAYLRMVEEEKDMQRWINAAHDIGAPGDCIGYLERECDWPLPNVWHGVSVEDQAAADERIHILQQVPSAVHWLSCEPLLGHIQIGEAAAPYPGIQWVVIGGESGSNYRPMDMEHARPLIAQCKSAGVPVFVKQDSGPRPGMQGRFTDEEWRLKEFPA